VLRPSSVPSTICLIMATSILIVLSASSVNLPFCDCPEVWQLWIQDPATGLHEGMIFFHNYIMLFVVFIGALVFFLLAHIISDFNAEGVKKAPRLFTHSSILEITWTLFPALLLLLIAVPSFSLLYSLDELINPAITLKVVGHQWYWSYEYSDFAYSTLFSLGRLNFDSYMISTSELTEGALRLLEVDNRVILPINTHIRLLVTAADVLHSWAVPSFGIKVDACPGRLSQASLFIKREGVYYGQCSEICGVNHGFMPIVVKSIETPPYVFWVMSKLNLL